MSLRRLPLSLTLVLLVPFAAHAQPRRAPAARGWDYVVRVDEGLGRVDVTCCFRGFRPRRLVAFREGVLEAYRLAGPRGAEPGLVRGDDAISVLPQGLGPDGCVRWSVDLGRLARVPGREAPRRVGEDLLVHPGLLLLRPAAWSPDVRCTVRFELPEGRGVAVAWPARPHAPAGTFDLDPQALLSDGVIAIGRFEAFAVEAAGATFDIVVLDRPLRATRDGLAHWIAEAARAVATLHGRFPSEHVQVIVWPGGRSATPAGFGRTYRSGGDMIVYHVSGGAPDEAFPGEWVGVHEMLHLGMPGTTAQDWWFQEGFVSYHQEVTRTRAGFQSLEEGWGELLAGFGRGRTVRTGRPLAEDSARMHQTRAYWRVYWGGAAIALRCDLAIRRHTGGRRCLDDAMHLLRRRHPDWSQPQRGLDLLAEVDAWLGAAICVPIAEEALAAREFPDVGAALEALGIERRGGGIVLSPRPEAAALRRAIMGPRADGGGIRPAVPAPGAPGPRGDAGR